MNKKMPVIKQIDWLSVLPRFVFPGIIIFLYYLTGVNDFLIFGCFTYILISLMVRNLIAKEHRKGIRNVHKQKYNDAIDCFQKSYCFFAKYKWLDKYRYIFLLSSSKISYKEMALCNIAFMYSQIGDGEKSEYYYKIALEEFPNSILAKSALNMINSIKENK